MVLGMVAAGFGGALTGAVLGFGFGWMVSDRPTRPPGEGEAQGAAAAPLEARVLRLEMQLMVFNRCGLMTLNCGTKIGSGKDAIWVRNYRNYTPNKEGGGTRGAPPPMFDEEVEQEADEDEKDDDGPGAVDLDEVAQPQDAKHLPKWVRGRKGGRRDLQLRRLPARAGAP